MNKDKKHVPFDSLRVLLGMKELPKVPEVEVYQGQQFLFSTNKQSNKTTGVDKAATKQRKDQAVGVRLTTYPNVELRRKQFSRRTGQFSLVSADKATSKSSLQVKTSQ